MPTTFWPQLISQVLGTVYMDCNRVHTFCLICSLSRQKFVHTISSANILLRASNVGSSRLFDSNNYNWRARWADGGDFFYYSNFGNIFMRNFKEHWK